MPGIADWLPVFHVGQRHEILVAASPEQALGQALATPVAPDRLVRLLFVLRGFRPRGTIADFFAAHGFLVLERTSTTFVAGLLTRGLQHRAVDTPAAWRAASLQRSLKIAADFHAESVAGGARLITETRVTATDARTLLLFRLYWMVVGPFSSLIRRRWLRAAAEVAARG